MRADGETAWALAFELDVPADPMADLDFSVRTLRGDEVYGADTSTSPSQATLVVRIGTDDDGTSQAFALPLAAFRPPTSEAEDACGGHTCTDVLLDALVVRP